MNEGLTLLSLYQKIDNSTKTHHTMLNHNHDNHQASEKIYRSNTIIIVGSAKNAVGIANHF